MAGTAHLKALQGTATAVESVGGLWPATSDYHSESNPAGSLISPHDDAVGRLEGALAEQGRRRRQYEAAFETSDERNAYVRLSEANERVATRARWLQWVDQHWDRGRSAALARRTR
jgi:hypothetical protein